MRVAVSWPGSVVCWPGWWGGRWRLARPRGGARCAALADDGRPGRRGGPAGGGDRRPHPPGERTASPRCIACMGPHPNSGCGLNAFHASSSTPSCSGRNKAVALRGMPTRDTAGMAANGASATALTIVPSRRLLPAHAGVADQWQRRSGGCRPAPGSVRLRRHVRSQPTGPASAPPCRRGTSCAARRAGRGTERHPRPRQSSRPFSPVGACTSNALTPGRTFSQSCAVLRGLRHRHRCLLRSRRHDHHRAQPDPRSWTTHRRDERPNRRP
jgi:hypothetical protein